MAISNINDQRVINFEFQTNVLHKDELFFRVKILNGKKEGSKFYVHDSLNHVQKDVVKKRILTSRDLASKYYVSTSGASYRYSDQQ